MKRFLYGLVAFGVCHVLVHHLFGFLYALAGRPFDGSIFAGIVYGCALGFCSLLICRLILTKAVDRRLADSTIVSVAVVSAAVLAIAVAVALLQERVAGPLVILPTLAIWAPWFVGAVIVATVSRKPLSP